MYDHALAGEIISKHSVELLPVLIQIIDHGTVKYTMGVSNMPAEVSGHDKVLGRTIRP